ncbi:MAG: N-acetylmuramoyl-L-alanine amidase family protein [Flavobacteriaceae bacterium]
MIFLRMYQEFLSYSPHFNIRRKRYLFYFLFILFISPNALLNAQEKPFVVVLDAGHGGHDSGNRGNGYFEKKIALTIALKIGKQLENNKDFKVIYTRKSDVFVDLIERANIANRSDADLFISIHCDAFSSSRAFGAGTFVLGLHENERNFKVAQKENSVIFLEKDYEKNYDGFDPNDPESVISLILMQETYLDQSIAAASSIQQSFVKNLNRKDRTVKQAGFIVLKYTYMPSVLIETGFLTNASEGAFLNSAKGQNSMADAIARAIINYKKQRDASFQINVVTAEATNSQSFSDTASDIVFKVQIAASKKKLEPVSYNFKGLTSISLEKSGKLYRYYYQKSSSYDSAKKYVKEAQNKGFKNAFLVAFDGENKISIEEALKRLK